MDIEIFEVLPQPIAGYLDQLQNGQSVKLVKRISITLSLSSGVATGFFNFTSICM